MDIDNIKNVCCLLIQMDGIDGMNVVDGLDELDVRYGMDGIDGCLDTTLNHNTAKWLLVCRSDQENQHRPSLLMASLEEEAPGDGVPHGPECGLFSFHASACNSS